MSDFYNQSNSIPTVTCRIETNKERKDLLTRSRYGMARQVIALLSTDSPFDIIASVGGSFH